MKIGYRILLINFAIVALIIGSSGAAFYSIMYNVLSSQQSKYLINSSNDFSYFYREILQSTEDDFFFLLKNNKDFTTNDFRLLNKNIDFILEANSSSSAYLSRKFYKDFVIVPKYNFTIEKFLESNPYALIKSYKDTNGKFYYYGRIINDALLNEISKKIGAEVAVVWKNSPSEISNEQENQKFIYPLTQALKNLSKKTNDSKIYSQEAESTDILATLHEPALDFKIDNGLKFLIFTTLNETADLKSNLKYILLIIGVASILLSLILILVFTDKIRKQLSQLNDATELIKKDNFKHKIEIKSKDEIGKLAAAFNNMQDVLRKNQRVRNEYSEFITLINQNPTLTEISDAALKKIIRTCGFTVGALYTVYEDQIVLTTSYGFGKDYLLSEKATFFNTVLDTKETLEFNFTENFPLVKTGTVSIEIKYLLILPVIFNNEIIALLELGASEKLADEAREYLSNIQEQLAIGLTNATAFVKMENLVEELKTLNENYQKQNVRISSQNETLIKLHNELKEKAEELSVQKQKAETSTNVKSQFLASMSHELRTPMNSILGLTELILEEPSLGKKNKERLQVVLKSGNRLMNLINDILDLSKIEAGKMDIHEENILLDELIKEIETSIKPLAENKGLSFKVIKHSKTKIIVNIDKEKITQVLMNLLGNAVKFTNKGKIELHVTVIDDNQIKFDVMDSGVGISDEDQKIIFEEFRQVDGTITRKHSGTGLGLSICQKIANLLDGTLSVQSKFGSGSNFSFTIPIKTIEMTFAEKDLSINLETLKKNIHHPVLVIDDDPEVRYTIGQYLISKGYEVVYAENGEKGIEEAKNIQPFAITLDVLLPKKDGWNILKELKEDSLTKDIPVILISIVADKKLGYGLGAFEYFIKPVSSEKLISAFDRLESYVKRKINRIVLVDDDELEFEKFKNYIKDTPIRIDYIKDSEIAFNKISEIKPDLIILDLLMPKVDGITLSHKLKANRETKNIPIIISTAKTLSEDEKESLNRIVENITVKSQNHQLDVLKVVRDRLNIQEISLNNGESIISKDEAEIELTKIENKAEEPKEYFGEILIVDDDPDTLFTISELVESCGCKPITASNGIECLEKLKIVNPDLVLLDIMMPVMDGFQTIKKIRENDKLKDLPVFAVSAKAMIDDKSIILKHGFNDFIPKPVNAAIINFKLQKIFSEIKTI